MYFSLLSYVDGVIGNSSSGLLEVPSFKKATINIGNRQSGRLKANSVVDCGTNEKEISKAIATIYTKEYKSVLKNIINPYGEPGASRRIFEILNTKNFTNLLVKKFHDIQ